MPKPKKLFLTNPEWRRLQRTKFVEFGFAANPAAQSLLFDKILDRTTPSVAAASWASQFNLANTWVEQWAASTLEDWTVQHHQHGKNFRFSLPSIELFGAASPFKFSIEYTPIPLNARGKTIGGALLDVTLVAANDWDLFAAEMRLLLDAELERYRATLVEHGSLVEATDKLDPENLNLTLRLAAEYYFAGRTVDEIVASGTTASVVYDRLKLARTILGL